MNALAIVLILTAFAGGWLYTARTLKSMGPWLPHLLGFPVGFVLMFCMAAILFFTGVIQP